MEFEDALKTLKAGETISNMNWNGTGMDVRMQVPTDSSKMGVPYLYITNSAGVHTPWVPSTGDLFSDAWIIVGDDE